MLKTTVPFLGLALLAGCSLAPHYERPAAPVAKAYPLAPSTATSVRPAADVAWRDFFDDARLKRLIELALENNRDLRVAALNVDRVRALYRIQRTALIPTLNATADGTRQRLPGDLTSSGDAQTTSTYHVGLEVPSYELDFFGRVTSLRDQVLQQYLATDEARASARLSLISAVARQYLTQLALSEQLDLARQSLDASDKAYNLDRQSFEAGVSSELDLRTAEGQRATYRAAVAALEQQVAQADNALTLLIGAPLPADLPPAGSLATQKLIADLPVGLPSELLERRPDIRSAEHTLEAANANIGVARAAFFPSIKLTAFAGVASGDLSGLFDGGSGYWKFAPTINVPIFAAGANRARLDVAKVEQRISVANYEKAIQGAFREVADALAVRSTIDAQISAQQDRVTAAKQRHALSRQRFEAGVDSSLPVLLAEQEEYAAEQALISARLARLQNLTTLYAALGGGWSDPASTDVAAAQR